MSCSWVGKEGGRLWGVGLGGAWRARLLPTEGKSIRPSTFASVFCAPSSSCLSSQSSFWFILWWSSSLCVCMLNRCFRRYSQAFSTPLHAYVEEGWAGVFQLVYCWWLFPAWRIRLPVGDGSVSLFFTGGWLMCMCFVCVCTHTHTHCMWGPWMWARVSGRDTWGARKKSICTVVIVYIYTVRCTKYTCIYICWATGRNLDYLPFCFLLTCFFFNKKERKKMWAKPPISQI